MALCACFDNHSGLSSRFVPALTDGEDLFCHVKDYDILITTQAGVWNASVDLAKVGLRILADDRMGLGASS